MRKVIVLAVISLIVALIYHERGLFTVATVNGQPISKHELVAELEKEGGKNVLDSLITKSLILQEAKKQKITATQADIDNEIKDLEANLKKQGQDLDTALSSQGLTRKDLGDQMKTQVLIKKLLSSQIAVTDQEIADYMKANKTVTNKDDAKAALTQQKLSEKFQSWMTDLKSKAKIDYYVKY